MPSFNAKIGTLYDSLTEDNISEIEKEFPEEFLPDKKRKEYILEKIGEEEDVGKYEVVLLFNSSAICIARNLDVILKNKNKEELKELLNNVLDRLRQLLPQKNLNASKLYPIKDFDPFNKPKYTDTEPKKKILTRLVITIIGAVAGAITLGTILYVYSLLPNK